MAYNVYALMAGHSMNFQMEQKYSNRTNLPARQIVEVMIHSSIENFQRELQPNSEQKVDELHFITSSLPMRSGVTLLLVLSLQLSTSKKLYFRLSHLVVT